MDSPDLFWGPLLGIHTGMRIGEATQIRCTDIHQAPGSGLHYIHVYKSKTPGGIRNVPISAALIELGFWDYVGECRAAGADRLFPHRALINHSHSKELSAGMLAYQRARRIKAPQTSFHSFRVNVITQMHNNDSNTAKVMKIVGHDDWRRPRRALGLRPRPPRFEAHRGQAGMADRRSGFAIQRPVRQFFGESEQLGARQIHG